MYKLYILKSSRFNRHYIGITDNLDNRLRKHNSGSVRSTKFCKPWVISYVENFDNKTDARKREIYLKKTAGVRKEIFDKIDK